ncbi:MAG: DUF4157 domain-containing protein [Methanosarcinales archaeon]|nr:DUF4157 domain-containing protein [Methanosarcinales archaeon]
MVQRQVEPEEEEEEEELQAKATSDHLSEVNSNLESHILSLKGGGQPLPELARAYFEPRFARNFSQVRVHSDAQAFTVGQDVVFGAGEFAPGASEGRRLMAHELTHIVQQNRLINGSMNQKSTPIQFVAPPQIQRECQHFDAGWLDPSTN